MKPEMNVVGWAVGQGSTEDVERVIVHTTAEILHMTPLAATQFATALLMAAKNVEAINKENEAEE